ncbi:MAG: methyltransferase domain-containing protein [Caldilineaceae bacterium]
MIATNETETVGESIVSQTKFEDNNRALKAYYRFHARVYDLTRWSFLFGRKAIVARVADIHQPRRVLEVGCGTGQNLLALHRHFPQAQLTGLDLSPDMLTVAGKNLARHKAPATFQWGAYGSIPQPEKYDLILFSYALTMFNPGWEVAIEQAYDDLATGGMIAVVDFHNSPWPAFKRWMGVNHVRMDGHLLRKLQTQFVPCVADVKAAYGGVWSYLLYVGGK